MADTKITGLTELTVVDVADLLAIVDDPGGSPVTKKVTVDNINAAFDHGARVYNNANQSIATATETAVTFNSERWDTDAYHDTGSNTSRLTVPSGQDGKYLIGGNLRWAGHADGLRIIEIMLNGTTRIAYQDNEPETTANLTQNISTVYELAATDYVELIAYQSSGGALNLVTLDNAGIEFWIQRLA